MLIWTWYQSQWLDGVSTFSLSLMVLDSHFYLDLREIQLDSRGMKLVNHILTHQILFKLEEGIACLISNRFETNPNQKSISDVAYVGFAAFDIGTLTL
ncbi:MAG: hypothetical protein REH83_07355 [Rickettsiella sp.]|nr:hypothetical protein [Rickettsiella sp.]